MISVLDSRSSSLGLSPDGEHCVVFLSKTLEFQCLSLTMIVYKRVAANLMLGVTLQCIGTPSRVE